MYGYYAYIYWYSILNMVPYLILTDTSPLGALYHRDSNFELIDHGVAVHRFEYLFHHHQPNPVVCHR